MSQAEYFLRMCDAKDMVFISADWWLLYPGTGFDQIGDVKALLRFLSAKVNSDLPHGTILNSSRIAVAGVSAGGCIARLAALRAELCPVAILNLFSTGSDFLTDCIIRPQRHFEIWLGVSFRGGRSRAGKAHATRRESHCVQCRYAAIKIEAVMPILMELDTAFC